MKCEIEIHIDNCWMLLANTHSLTQLGYKPRRVILTVTLSLNNANLRSPDKA